MRRRQIVDALCNVQNAFDESGLTRVFRRVSTTFLKYSGHGSAPAGLAMKNHLLEVVNAYRIYQIHQSRFSSVESEFIKLRSLSSLSNPVWWSNLIRSLEHVLRKDAKAAELVELGKKITFARSLITWITGVIGQEIIEPAGDRDDDSIIDLMTIVLPEGRGIWSSPMRIAMLMRSMSEIYDVFARIEESYDVDITVVSCDSGSEKSFTFMGLLKIFDGMRSLLAHLWDVILIADEKRRRWRIDSIKGTVDIFRRINELREARQISGDVATQLENQILLCVLDLRRCGAIVPGVIEERGMVTSAIQQEPRKLLTSGPANAGSDDKGM